MEVMDVGGSWVGLGGRPRWALGNRQLRRVGRQGSCEEVLVQEGLGVARDSRRTMVTPRPCLCELPSEEAECSLAGWLLPGLLCPADLHP